MTPELVEISGAEAPASKWQQPFDAALTNVFQVQSDIAARVAGELGVVLQPNEAQWLQEKPTKDLAAYDEFSAASRSPGAWPCRIRRACARRSPSTSAPSRWIPRSPRRGRRFRERARCCTATAGRPRRSPRPRVRPPSGPFVSLPTVRTGTSRWASPNVSSPRTPSGPSSSSPGPASSRRATPICSRRLPSPTWRAAGGMRPSRSSSRRRNSTPVRSAS